MTPLIFGQSFGWLHPAPADEPQRASGMVLCGPVGFEKQAVHRAWRLLAERLAARGFPVLRFDYPATGDATGDEADPELIAKWIGSIVEARAELIARTGVTEVVLCGLHLGALLAAYAGQDLPGPHMVLLAPQGSGRRLVRTLRLIANVADGHARRNTTRDGLETAGLRLSAGGVAALEKLDFQQLTSAPARDILLLDDPALAPLGSVATPLETAGATVDRQPFSDLEMLMQDADRSDSPDAAWGVVERWLMDRIGMMEPDRVVEAVTVPWQVLTHLGNGVSEQPIMFGASPGARPVGVYTTSLAAERSPTAVLFCNTGSNPHYGPGRMSVHLARYFATAGVASLRFDLPGIGDSALPDEHARPHIYIADRREAFGAAIDALSERGHARVVVMGVCSGAYHALRAAGVDLRVRDVVLVNQLIYDWSSQPMLGWVRGALSRLGGIRPGTGQATDSLSGLFQAQTSRTRVAWQRLRRTGFRIAALPRAVGLMPTASQAQRRVRALAARGVRIMIAVGEADASRTLLEGHFGERGRDLLGLGDTRLQIDNAFDHSMASEAARERLWPALLEFVNG